jgi:hypothetical protein
MNNTNTTALIRTLVIYAVVVPLAIWIGFMVAGPFDMATFSYIGIMALILVAPLLLRWHHFLLIATWNLGMTVFFLPGKPPIWLLMTALSLGISVLHRTINERARFISAPSITWPLVFLIAVVVFTAKMTGGIGLHSLGDETVGGGFYIRLLVGILGYFAITAQPIPPPKVKLYVSLFFLAGCAGLISDLGPFLPGASRLIFLFFPLSGYDLDQGPGAGLELNTYARFAGTAQMGLAGVLFMLARFGPRGIFTSGRLWRPVLFMIFFALMALGGFRNLLILCGGIFLIQCYIERFHRTRVFPAFVFAGLIGITLLIPFADKLPYPIQRSLAFLPLHIDPTARRDAEGSQEWRLQIWRDALPTVPQYLLLGKGYAISENQLAVASSKAFHYASDFQSVDLVGNYHSGPLSVVIPFGIWGCLALIWFWIASLRALYCNYRYGDAEFRTVNVFLLAYFVSKILLFLIIFGGLYGDMYYFTAIIGLSVGINGGVRKPAPAPARVAAQHGDAPLDRPRFQPFYPR